MTEEEEKIQVALGTGQYCIECKKMLLVTNLNNSAICNSCLINGPICNLQKYLNGLA
jgi:hypothetical protein